MSLISTQSIFDTALAKSSWRSHAISLGVHGLAVVLVFAIIVPAAHLARKSFEHITLIAPTLPEYKIKPQARIVTPRLIVLSIPAPKLPAKVFVPPPPVARPPARVLPIAPEIKDVQPQVHAIELKSDLPPAPKAPIQIGLFQQAGDSAKAAPAPPKLSVGAFGDTNGVRHGDNSRAAGGLQDAGFGNAGTPAKPQAAMNGAIHTGSFGDSMPGPAMSVRKGVENAPTTTPVEILFKPKPAYTEEARAMRVEGQVSLQVVFLSTGAIKVVRILRGLGHGLDEAAEQAALLVRFKPATRGGVPVDTDATISITFELT